jgi:hypothetical protein
MTDVYFQGEKLPPLRPGKVYAMQIYPGGRKVVRQCNADQLSTPSAAAKALTAGRMVYVWPDDAVDTLQRWERAKGAKVVQ